MTRRPFIDWDRERGCIRNDPMVTNMLHHRARVERQLAEATSDASRARFMKQLEQLKGLIARLPARFCKD